MSEFIVIACSALVGVICGILIFHRSYKDRLPRRIGLAGFAISAFTQIALIIGQDAYPIRPLAVLLWISAALFFSSHVCSFITRFKRRDQTWYEGTDTIVVSTKGKR